MTNPKNPTQMVKTQTPQLTVYSYSEYSIAIEAESREEADKILQKRLEAKTIPLTPSE